MTVCKLLCSVLGGCTFSTFTSTVAKSDSRLSISKLLSEKLRNSSSEESPPQSGSTTTFTLRAAAPFSSLPADSTDPRISPPTLCCGLFGLPADWIEGFKFSVPLAVESSFE